MPDNYLPYSLRQGTYMPSNDQHLFSQAVANSHMRGYLGPEDRQRRGTSGGPPVVVVGVVVVLLLFPFRLEEGGRSPVNIAAEADGKLSYSSLLLTSYTYR